jgi:hypothetical protein
MTARWARRASAMVALASVLTFSIDDARAQSASTDAAELFEQGRVALSAKDYKTACAKLEASLALERAVGTLISLATCEEGLNKLATARQHWREAEELAIATHDKFDRAAYAQKRLAEIDHRVPQITITVRGDAVQLQVARDGVNLPASALATPLRVDPGTHTLTVTAQNRKSKSVTIQLAEGERRTIALEIGEPVDESRRDVTPPSAAPVAETTTGGTQRTLAWASGGLGVVALGVGVVTGLVASSKWSDAKSTCGTGCAPDSPAFETRDDARTFATVSTISFVVAGIGLAAAAVLFLTAPSGSPSTSVARARGF